MGLALAGLGQPSPGWGVLGLAGPGRIEIIGAYYEFMFGLI